MFRILMQKPLSQAEAISKLSENTPIKQYTTQILALDEINSNLPGHNFCIMA